MIHRGQIVEKIVRKSGYSLTKLSSDLGISRNTLYNRFLFPNLSWHFISEIGKFIRYDFTLEFPELKEEAGLLDQNAVFKEEGKYTRLLEKYNKLLEMVIRVVDVNGLHDLHQEITQMLEK